MPIPEIHIHDQSCGLPRQPVPLRLAYLIAWLSADDFRPHFDNFLFLLADRQEDYCEYLTGYAYLAGSAPRQVRRQTYKQIEKACPPEATEAELVALLPRDHFVWSDELADAFSQFCRDCPGYEDAQAAGMGLVWTPDLRELRSLIEECVDLSALVPPVAFREPDPRIMQPGRVLGVDPENAKQDADRIRVLHVSDLHFTKETPESARLQWLLEAIRQDRKDGLGFKKFDYLVITGDCTDKASREGFEKAYEFVSHLIKEINLPAECCVLVPGNHDVDLNLSAERHIWVPGKLQKGKPAIEPDPESCSRRFKLFSELLYEKLRKKPYPEQYAEQWESILFWETGIQFLALNSCWQIDNFNRKRSGVHEVALANAIAGARAQERKAREAGKRAIDQPLLRIAVWHHPLAGPEAIKNQAFLGHLKNIDVRLILHGDAHEMQREQVPDRSNGSIHVVGAGSFGAKADDRPEATPRLFNVLEITRDLKSVRVHARQQRNPDGAWERWCEFDDPNGSAGRLPYYDVDF